MTELPISWTQCEIGEVLSHVKMTSKNEPDREIWYLDISSIDSTTNRVTEPKRLKFSEAPSRARQIVKVGDVLFSTVRPYLRKIARVTEKYDGEIASTGFAVLRAADGIDPGYIFYKSISHDFVSSITGEQYGVSYPAVKEEQVLAQTLELPPTNEQRRIVEKVEALFDEIDKGVESLQAAKAALGLYRQSLLKAAFEGRLTAEWRAQNPDKLEDPQTLLARIRKEREARYKSDLETWKEAVEAWRENGGEHSKPLKPGAPSISLNTHINEIDTLPSLPENWTYTKLANLGDLGRGKSKHRPRNDPRLFGGQYPFIQTGEVKAAGRLITAYNTTYSEFGLRQSKLWPAGTLCITIAANIAQTAFLSFDACFPDSVVGFSTVEELVAPQFVELFIKSAQSNIEAYAPATAQKNINLTTLEELIIPLCGTNEQIALVTLLDKKLEAAERLETEIDRELLRTNALRQSILKDAFAGKLVAQDPSDEPASALLERIQKERTSAAKKGKRKASA